MESQESRKGHDGRLSQDSKARVVNLRAWKARKRIRSMRGRMSWARYVLRQLSYILGALSIAAAVLSCIPSFVQAASVIWTWFFASMSMIDGLVLNVLHDRKWSNRLLAISLGCMAVSFVAGLVSGF